MGRGIFEQHYGYNFEHYNNAIDIDFLAEEDDKTIQQEVVEDHPSGADGGGKSTSIQQTW